MVDVGDRKIEVHDRDRIERGTDRVIFYDQRLLSLSPRRDINNGTDKLIIREHPCRKQNPFGGTGLCQKTCLKILHISLGGKVLEKRFPVGRIGPHPRERQGFNLGRVVAQRISETAVYFLYDTI